MVKLVEKPRSVRALGPVDISGLLPLVARMSEKTWNREDDRKENDFDCFHDTRHVVFRFIRGNIDPLDFYSNPSWDIWAHKLLPVMVAAIRPYNFTSPVFPKAMFARLAANGAIDRHVDGAGSNLRTHKIHVPLVSNPEAIFEAGGERLHLKVGEAYEVNNIGPHAAVNAGAEDRIHFIFEVFEGAGEQMSAA